jgi:hypothetical protein
VRRPQLHQTQGPPQGRDYLNFDARVGGCEVPIGLCVVCISVVLPGGDPLDEDLFIGDAAVETPDR